MVISEVKTFLNDITFNIKAMEAQRKRMGEFGADQSDLETMDWQIAQMKSLKLQAQVEIGKRSAEMETNKEFHGNRFSEIRNAENTKTKAEQLAELDITPQRAHEYEKLAKHEDVVNQYIGEMLSKGKAPSTNGALNEIKKQSEYIEEGEGEVDYSKETGERVLAAIKANPEKSHRKLAEELGVSRKTVDRVANNNAEEISEIDASKLSTRAFNKQIMELAKSKSIYSEDDIKPSEYTVDDALGEINVMWNQFYDNMMFLFRHRMTVVGGQREVTDLIKSFKTEIDQLINVVKKKGVVI